MVSFKKGHYSEGYDIHCDTCGEKIGYTSRGWANKGFSGHWQVKFPGERGSWGTETRKEAGSRAMYRHECEVNA